MPRIQVVSRDPTAPNARDQCEGVVRALETVCNATLNTTLYFRIARLQDPFLLHRDAARRVYYACNLEVERQPS